MSDSLQPRGLHGILQARILELVAFPFFRGSSQLRDWTQVSCIVGGFFTEPPYRSPWWLYYPFISLYLFPHPSIHSFSTFLLYMLFQFKVNMKVAQSCLTLCDPMDYTVHDILQARILEWIAYPFSRGSSQPRDWTQVFSSLKITTKAHIQSSHENINKIPETIEKEE